MPEKTGVELATQMTAIDKSVPIILCSGYATNITKSVIEKAGIKKFLMKPITIEALSKQIQDILKK